MSRSFLCTLAGVAMTLLAWYGPWAWPAWPAFTVLRLLGDSYDDMSQPARGAVIVVLIILNSGFWALLFYLLAGSVRKRAKR